MACLCLPHWFPVNSTTRRHPRAGSSAANRQGDGKVRSVRWWRIHRAHCDVRDHGGKCWQRRYSKRSADLSCGSAAFSFKSSRYHLLTNAGGPRPARPASPVRRHPRPRTEESWITSTLKCGKERP